MSDLPGIVVNGVSGRMGQMLVRRISADLFYKVAYSLVFLLALKLVWDGSAGLLAGG